MNIDRVGEKQELNHGLTQMNTDKDGKEKAKKEDKYQCLSVFICGL